MKTIHRVAMASAVAFSAFAFVAMASSAARAGPIVPPGHYCLTYDHGSSDCSFTSYAQCLATASGIDSECYGKPVRDDEADLRPAAHPAPIQSFAFPLPTPRLSMTIISAPALAYTSSRRIASSIPSDERASVRAIIDERASFETVILLMIFLIVTTCRLAAVLGWIAAAPAFSYSRG